LVLWHSYGTLVADGSMSIRVLLVALSDQTWEPHSCFHSSCRRYDGAAPGNCRCLSFTGPLGIDSPCFESSLQRAGALAMCG
jgi:hypothetical protein